MITDISNIDTSRLAKRVRGIKLTEKQTIPITENKQLSDNMISMETYRTDWDSMYDVRKRFRRNASFNRGDQWIDSVINDDGDVVTEDEYIREQGKLPLKQNLMRPMLKSLVGLFRSESGKSIVISRREKMAEVEKMLSNAIQAVLQSNNTKEIDARTFELFILSGLPVQRVGWDMIKKYKRYDVSVEYYDMQYLFVNSDMRDIRGNDLRRIGMLHDLTFDELYASFAKNQADKDYLSQLYGSISKEEIMNAYGFSSRRGEDLSFYYSNDPYKCRVIEVWEQKSVDVIEFWDKSNGQEGYWDGTLEELERINYDRIEKKLKPEQIPIENWGKYLIEYDTTVGLEWFFKYLTPMGHVLRQGRTPYEHGMHPFIILPYPLINGEIWGPAEDYIDQQKYINRLITIWDFIMNSSAKNTVVFDKKTLDGQSEELLGKKYKTIGGVIILDLAQGGKVPIELGGQMPNLGITELIGLQIKWMQDISGVQPAMQGQQGSANTPASKYAMEIQQTSLNNRDILESFASFRKDRDLKVLQTIIQFYKSKRYLAISGKGDTQMYDPEAILDDVTDFEIVIGQINDSPTYKNWVDDMLKDFVLQGMIDMEMFLSHSNLPFAEALLEDLRNKKQQVEQGSLNPKDAANQLQASYVQKSEADMNKINQLSFMINGK